MIKLAIISPVGNAYSETFIQVHKNIKGVNASYYFDGFIPRVLEGYGNIELTGVLAKIIYQLEKLINKSELNYSENVFLQSLKKNAINCVLAEYGPTGAAVMPICKHLSIPLIVHFHGYDASGKEIIEKYGSAYKDMFAYASGIIVVSKKMFEKILDLGCPREKLIYNPCGPADDFLRVIPTYSEKKFTGLGRFVDKKAPYYTILAFHKVLQAHPDAKLVMGGDGPLHNTCRNLVSLLGMDASVEFPGIITPEQFRSHLGDALAFVQHSITAANGDMEGTPVAVLEASAAGLPVISTVHAGIPDVIIHEETGFLVREHDVEGMARWMQWIIENPETGRQMGARGKARIMEHFTIKKHLDILGKVISQSVKAY